MSKGIYYKNGCIYQDGAMITDRNPIELAGGLVAGNPEMAQQAKNIQAAAIAKGMPVNKAPVSTYSPQVLALMAKGWDVLTRSNELAVLKAMDVKAYNEVFEAKFGNKPGEKPNKDKEVKIDVALVKKMKGMSWDELEKANLLKTLAGMPGLYNEKYKQKFGSYPNQSRKKG